MRTSDGVPTRSATASSVPTGDRTAGWPDRLGLMVPVALAVVIVAAAVSFVVLWSTDALSEPSIVIADPLLGGNVVVAIDGAIATPGVYELPGGSRVQHIVDAAGGVLPDADLAAVNPAQRIADGERIVIPSTSEPPILAEPVAVQSEPPAGGDRIVAPDIADQTPLPDVAGDVIDINTATQAELESLPGIGPVKAADIIAFRTENGPFGSVDELDSVDGISPEMVVELAPFVRAGP